MGGRCGPLPSWPMVLQGVLELKRSVTRRQVRAALNAVDGLIPAPWNLELLVGRIEAHRDRPVRLVAADFPAASDVSGLWIGLRDVDYICYARNASPAVREQTIAHELGHLLMNHQLADGTRAAAVAELLAGESIHPALIQRFLARTSYGDVAEAAAEEFGTRLIRIGRRRRVSNGNDPLGRLTGSLR